jgi:hypothetical protein
MTDLFDLDNLGQRLKRLVEADLAFDPRGAAILTAALARGELPRGRLARSRALANAWAAKSSANWSSVVS